MAQRRSTSVRLTEEARRGWRRVSRATGVPFNALLEAIGRQLDDGTAELPDEWIDLGREIDDDGRTR